MLTIKDLHKVLAGQGIASKIRKTLKHKGLRPSIKTQNEKLFKILIKKQAVHRDYGGGIEHRIGICAADRYLCMAAVLRGEKLRGLRTHFHYRKE